MRRDNADSPLQVKPTGYDTAQVPHLVKPTWEGYLTGSIVTS